MSDRYIEKLSYHMIKSFSNWLVEGVTPEQADKEIAKMQKWADEKSVEMEVCTYGQDKQIFFATAFNRWELSLEAAVKKSGQNSNYQQTYSKDRDNLKWYYTVPGQSSNSYNYRDNKKPGNFNTLKGFMETALELEKTFEICSQFLSTLGLEFDAKDNYKGTHKKLVWSIKSKTEYSIKLRLPSKEGSINLEYDSNPSSRGSEWEVWFNPPKSTGKRTQIDISNGSFFLEIYNGLAICENDLNKDAEIALNALANKPFDEVWNIIKGGNWKEIAHTYRGHKLKKFGV